MAFLRHVKKSIGCSKMEHDAKEDLSVDLFPVSEKTLDGIHKQNSGKIIIKINSKLWIDTIK